MLTRSKFSLRDLVWDRDELSTPTLPPLEGDLFSLTRWGERGGRRRGYRTRLVHRSDLSCLNRPVRQTRSLSCSFQEILPYRDHRRRRSQVEPIELVIRCVRAPVSRSPGALRIASCCSHPRWHPTVGRRKSHRTIHPPCGICRLTGRCHDVHLVWLDRHRVLGRIARIPFDRLDFPLDLPLTSESPKLFFAHADHFYRPYVFATELSGPSSLVSPEFLVDLRIRRGVVVR
jgi:hypothetical protein